MNHESIRRIKDDEYLCLQLDQQSADAIYALIMWLNGWQENRHDVPGYFQLAMAYRSAKIIRKKK